MHPEVRRLQDAEAVVEARISEEHRAKQLLSTLDEIGPDAEGFDTLLQQLWDDVLAHEEREELPLLRKAVNPERLQTMAARRCGRRKRSHPPSPRNRRCYGKCAARTADGNHGLDR